MSATRNDAAKTWDTSVSRHGAIWSAAGTHSADPFAKFPDWLWPHVPESGTAVDLGCGYGRLAIPILRERPGLRLTGLDASREMLTSFEKLVEEHGMRDRVDLRLTSFPPVELPDASADLVYTSAVLLHNPHEVARDIVAEIHRILKPGGKAAFSGSFVARWNTEGIQNYISQAIWPPLRKKNGPVRTYTKRMVQDLFGSFEKVEIFTTHATVLPRSIHRLQMPFGETIRALNRQAEQIDLTRRFFAREFEVVASKPLDPR